LAAATTADQNNGRKIEMLQAKSRNSA